MIVASATVAIIASEPGDIPDWPAIAAPMKPAGFLVFGLGGGPHGIVAKIPMTTANAMEWLVDVGQDLRYACRTLRKTLRKAPAFRRR